MSQSYNPIGIKLAIDEIPLETVFCTICLNNQTSNICTYCRQGSCDDCYINTNRGNKYDCLNFSCMILREHDIRNTYSPLCHVCEVKVEVNNNLYFHCEKYRCNLCDLNNEKNIKKHAHSTNIRCAICSTQVNKLEVCGIHICIKCNYLNSYNKNFNKENPQEILEDIVNIDLHNNLSDNYINDCHRSYVYILKAFLNYLITNCILLFVLFIIFFISIYYILQ
jgi:hypothetical protein